MRADPTLTAEANGSLRFGGETRDFRDIEFKTFGLLASGKSFCAQLPESSSFTLLRGAASGAAASFRTGTSIRAV
jgi:hypothetical protein